MQNKKSRSQNATAFTDLSYREPFVFGKAMFVGKRMEAEDEDAGDGMSEAAEVAAKSSADFFFLLRPRELVPVCILGDGVDLGETTIVWVEAEDLGQKDRSFT